MQASCPLCRGACHINAAEVKPNLLITKVIGARFADELAARAREATEDEEELNRLRLGLFLSPNTESLLFPGTPLTLFVWEPRYLHLMQQCMENRSEFGVQPSAEAMHGAAFRLMAVNRTHGGSRLFVQAVAHARYRCLTRPIPGEGEFGLVVAPLVEYIDDAPIGDDGVDAVEVNEIIDAQPLNARRALQGLSRQSQAQKLVGVCGAALGRLVTSIGGRAQAFIDRHGPIPSPTGPYGNAKQLSFYLADALALPMDSKLRCFNTTSTVERLLICYAFLREADAAASGAVHEAEPVIEAAAGTPQLPSLEHVTPEAVLLLFRAPNAGPPLRFDTLWQAFLAFLNSPLASSLAVFVLVIGLLWLNFNGYVVL